MSAAQTWAADFAVREQGLAGAKVPWPAAVRKRAIERFTDEGWPTIKQEDWRHTSLACSNSSRFCRRAASMPPPWRRKFAMANLAIGWCLSMAGMRPDLSDVGALPAGAQCLACRKPWPTRRIGAGCVRHRIAGIERGGIESAFWLRMALLSGWRAASCWNIRCIWCLSPPANRRPALRAT